MAPVGSTGAAAGLQAVGPCSGGAEPMAAGATATPRSLWRQVAVPAEHGGWSLTAEPVLLALLVAGSWPGAALGLAAMTAFLARTPVKLVMVDRWRHRWLDRTRRAVWVGSIEMGLILALVALAAATAERVFWVPLAVAAPLVGLELWYDMRSRGRRLVPELAGAVGIGSVAAAISLAGGIGLTTALGLWCVVAARSTVAIAVVRTQLARVHGRPIRFWPSDLAQVLAVVAVGGAWGVGAVPATAPLAVAAAAGVNLVALRRPPRRAVVLGAQQAVAGLIVIMATAAGVVFA